MSVRLLANVTCVAIGGRGLLLEGPPGSGKSTLALALIDRGAALIGDDGIRIDIRGDRLWALPPPNIAGRIEIRGVGLADMPTTSAPLCLALALGETADRLPEVTPTAFHGTQLPRLAFQEQGGPLRAEWAMRLHGLPLPADFA